MKKLVSCCFVVCVILNSQSLGGLSSSDLYRVLPEEEEFVDKGLMLFKHLSRLSQARAWARSVEVARISGDDQWLVYKSKLLRNYRNSLALPFPERTPLHAETVRMIDRGVYRIENILYQSMPDIWVTANLYVPQRGDGPYPGILFPCGHSQNGKASELYHSAALGLVSKGYVVLVYDPPGQGERYQYLKEDGTPEIGSPTREHSLLANPMFLAGKHLMAVRIWEGMRGIDYLLTRPEVDPEKIGCTGNSGGGTVTLHLVPLEERIKVAVPVGTVGAPDMELGTGGIGDGEQNLPMLVPRGITHADLMMLAWPRPYRLIKESQGGVYRGTRSSFVQANFLYSTLGHAERMSYLETERPHGYFKEMREGMYFWFGQWFYDRADDHSEPELVLENEADLICSKTGQILNERGKPLWRWTSEEVQRTLPRRLVPEVHEHALFRKEIQSEAAALLNNPQGTEVKERQLGEFQEGDVTITKLVLYSEEDIYLPCLFFRLEGPEPLPGVVLADSEGNTSNNYNLAVELAKAGYGLLSVDLRGYGETRITQRSSRDEAGGFEAQTLGIEAGIAYDGLKLGRSIFAMRAFDLVQSVNYLSSRKDIDPTRVGIVGRSSCGPPALYAALTDERTKGVLVDGSLGTFSKLVTSRLYTYHFMDFLPRVLRYHDLPQVAGALAPRVLWMLNLRDAEKNIQELAASEEAYAWTRECYEKLAETRNFRIKNSQSESARLQAYLDWAERTFSHP